MSQGQLSSPADAIALRVAVLEDDRFAKAGIIAELEEDRIDVVGEASDPNTLHDLVMKHQPDAIIIDLKLGRETHEYRGLDVIRWIKETAPNVKCIVVTAFPAISNFKASIAAGAEGFIVKENSVQSGLTMGEVVRRVVRGERYYDGELVVQIITPPKDHPGSSSRNPLTDREREVLSLVEHTNEQIAARLNITTNTVKAHLQSCFEKLSHSAGRTIDNRREAADVAGVLGYI